MRKMIMHRLLTLIGAVVIICLLAVPALAANPDGSLDGTSATATVDISLTILPYAEVKFDKDTLPITLNKKGSGKFHAKGQVWCNCPVTLTADVRRPADANKGKWKPQTVRGTIEPGKHEYKHLLTISISKGTRGDTFTLGLVNSTLDEPPPLEQGQAIVTVMQTL